MSGSFKGFRVLVLLKDRISQDLIQDSIQIPDVEWDFYTREFPEPLSDILFSDSYDLILLDKGIEAGFEKILEFFSGDVRYIPVILLVQEGNTGYEISRKNIWDYCELKDTSELKRFVSNFRRLKFARQNESENSEFAKIRNQYKDLLIENAKEGVAILQDGKIKYADPQIVRFLNTSLEELASSSFIEFIHPEDREIVNIIYKRRLSGDDISEKYTFRVMSIDGEYVAIENSGFTIMWDGKPATLNLVTNVTERVKSETDLRNSEEKYKGIVYSSPNGVLIMDHRGIILDINDSFLNIVGYEKEDYLNNKVVETPGLDEDQKGKAREYFGRIIAGEKLAPFEIRFTHSSGKTRYVEVRTRLIKSTEEKSGIIAICSDITDRNRTISELHEAKDKAEESDRLKTAFLANMSHEIRTPMNAIVGFSELLRTTNIQGPEREEYFNIINNSCSILSNLIDDIIDLAKIEAGQTTIAEDLCRPHEIMRELQRYFEEEIRKLEKPIKLVMDASIDPDLIIKSDEFRLRQILSNIIGNAVKFTEKGIIAWGCTIEKERDIKFFVKDTGIGISSENIELVFDRFRQMDDSSIRKYGGTGLGLPVSKSLVDLMGGEIWVESQIGKGSEFYFKIPFKPAKDEPYEETEVLTRSDMEYSFKNKGVLVVEDNLSNFEFIRAVLSRTKVKLFWADTGVKAVEMFKKKRKHIDLVLMDIQIPEMDGYEATGLMKKMREDIPIIAQTAFAMSRDKEKSLDAGCDDYISKPIKPSDLLNMLAKYL